MWCLNPRQAVPWPLRLMGDSKRLWRWTRSRQMRAWIGLTMIGMHLKKVAVPVRLENNKIGEALVVAARTRPKFIGGSRAVYDPDML